jgi:predicted transcriptional regulator
MSGDTDNQSFATTKKSTQRFTHIKNLITPVNMKVHKKLDVSYTVASNEIHKHGLSLKAVGLYLHILSKPDEWTFTYEGVAAQVKDGVDSIRTTVKELEESSFLNRTQKRTKNGKFNISVWEITDKPISEKPTSEKPISGKQRQVITNKVNTKEVSTNTYKRERVKNKNNELSEWINTYNQRFNTKFTESNLLGNFSHWRKYYSLELMIKSLEFLNKHDWLKDKHKPALILRQRDTSQNPVDRIGELLSLESQQERGAI